MSIVREVWAEHRKLSIILTLCWLSLATIIGLYLYGLSALQLTGVSVNSINNYNGLSFVVNQSIKPTRGFHCIITGMDVYARDGEIMQYAEQYAVARIWRAGDVLPKDEFLPNSVNGYILEGISSAEPILAEGERYVMTLNQYFYYDYLDPDIVWRSELTKLHREPVKVVISYTCFGFPYQEEVAIAN